MRIYWLRYRTVRCLTRKQKCSHAQLKTDEIYRQFVFIFRISQLMKISSMKATAQNYKGKKETYESHATLRVELHFFFVVAWFNNRKFEYCNISIKRSRGPKTIVVLHFILLVNKLTFALYELKVNYVCVLRNVRSYYCLQHSSSSHDFHYRHSVHNNKYKSS